MDPKLKKILKDRKKMENVWGTPFVNLADPTGRNHLEKVTIEKSLDLKDYGEFFDYEQVKNNLNLAYHLIDIAHGIAIDVECNLKKAHPELQLQMRRPLRIVKDKLTDMVRYVDKTLVEEKADEFCINSDNLKEQIFKITGITEL